MVNEKEVIMVVKGGHKPVLFTKGIWQGEVRYDVRQYYRKDSEVNVENHQKLIRQGKFSFEGLCPTKSGVSLTMDEFLLFAEEVAKIAEEITPKVGKK